MPWAVCVIQFFTRIGIWELLLLQFVSSNAAKIVKHPLCGTQVGSWNLRPCGSWVNRSVCWSCWLNWKPGDSVLPWSAWSYFGSIQTDLKRATGQRKFIINQQALRWVHFWWNLMQSTIIFGKTQECESGSLKCLLINRRHTYFNCLPLKQTGQYLVHWKESDVFRCRSTSWLVISRVASHLQIFSISD